MVLHHVQVQPRSNRKWNLRCTMSFPPPPRFGKPYSLGTRDNLSCDNGALDRRAMISFFFFCLCFGAQGILFGILEGLIWWCCALPGRITN